MRITNYILVNTCNLQIVNYNKNYYHFSTQVDSNVSHHHHQSMASTVHHRPPRAQNASTSSKVSVPSPIDRESPPTPNKKPRLNESGPPGSGILGSSRTVTDIDVPPIIVSQPVTLSTTQDQPSSSSVMDPLDDSEHYEGEEGDVEEGIDFNNLKTEPIQVYSGYEESDQSEMMHNESVGEGKSKFLIKQKIIICIFI